jgi:mannitol/fructose-specific phosphotransferase system IIA component (Ntr-type)
MRLHHLLSPGLVLTDLRARGTDEVIRTVSDHLAARGVVASSPAVEDALLARERSHPTVLGRGLALPHATLPGLEEPVLLVAVAREPVHFGPDADDPVTVFFVLLSPPGSESRHIKLLARICRLAHHPGFVDDLRDAAGPDEVVEIVGRVDRQHV